MDKETLSQASEKVAANCETQVDKKGQLKDETVRGDLIAQYKLPYLFAVTDRGCVANKLHFEMDKETLSRASEKVAAYYETQVDEKGQLKDETVRRDLVAQYKLPYLFAVTGRGSVANKLLDNMKEQFMQKDGDFLSYSDKNGLERKTSDSVLPMYWPYINGWIALAAARLGRFDISVPAHAFVEKFYNSSLKGYGICSEALSKGQLLDVDIFMSAHLGLLSMYLGDFVRAREVGQTLAQFVAKQPDLDKNFLLRMSGSTGELVTEYPEDLARFHCVSQTDPKQLHFMLGYPVMFLYFVHLLTQDDQYVVTAEKILSFQLKCDESLYSCIFSHKAAYGAGLMFKVTGKKEYKDMCEKICSYLLTQQIKDEYFLEKQPLNDQLTEIAIYFHELVSRVWN